MSALPFCIVMLLGASLHAQIAAVPFGVLPANPLSTPLLTASGDGPIVSEFPPFPSDHQPIAGVVSLRELRNPVPKKAVQAAYDAQKLGFANKIPQAIARLEEAIRIDPDYRDAHLNVGVLYARSGRLLDARAEFQKALAIGPPIGPIYSNLALICVALAQAQDAETFARQALKLEPESSSAKLALQFALTH